MYIIVIKLNVVVHSHAMCINSYIQFKNTNVLYHLYIHKHTCVLQPTIPSALLNVYFLWITGSNPRQQPVVVKGSKKSGLGNSGIENLWVKGVENCDYLGIKVVQWHLSLKRTQIRKAKKVAWVSDIFQAMRRNCKKLGWWKRN